MAMTNEQEKQLEELFKVKLKEQYNRGLHIGILSVSKVILDKLNDSSKPFMKRIKEIRKFCETPWNKKKVEQALKETTAKEEQDTDNAETSSDDDGCENTTENGEN